jgi:CRISPR-associated protein Cas1
MMGEDFRRDASLPGANALLNYGYAVLRAGVARGLCAAGLHPSLGIFHRHPHNTLPLADDLMEPFRPLIDLAVRRLLADGAGEVDVTAKRALAALLVSDLPTDAGTSPLSTCLIRAAASLAESYLSGTAALVFPHLDAEGRDGISADHETFGVSDHVDVRDVRPAGDDEA